MTTVDLSRSALQPRKHYVGARMQQGRVLTDDDFNEAVALEAEGSREALVDVVGPIGSPDDGFRIDPASVTNAGGHIDFTIQAGTMYLGGNRVVLHDAVPLSAQPDFLRQLDADRATGTGARTLAYLEVWQQPVSAVEDGELLEVALGGPDTTQRMRLMARVRLHHTNEASCHDAWSELTGELASAARGQWNADTAALDNDLTLTVGYTTTGSSDDLCAPEVASGYLGAENAAIRVQLVDPVDLGTEAAITWGFDDAAPLYRVSLETITVNGSPFTRITFLTAPKDQAHWPLLDQVVELVPWAAILDPNRELVGEGHGRCEAQVGGEKLSVGHGHLAKVTTGYDNTQGTVIIAGHPPAELTALASGHSGVELDSDGVRREFDCYLRVWDRGTDLGSAARIGVTRGVPVTLGNTGLTVTLQGTHLDADAHWIIAARPHTPDRVVPWVLEDGASPHGITTWLCPLALITWRSGLAHHQVQDCRVRFRPLTRLKTCCTFTVGDGERSHGDYTSIQAAIDALPPEGGRVCVLPGAWEESLTLSGLTDVHIHGCGAQSVLTNPSGTEPAIHVTDCQRIRIDELHVVSEQTFCVVVDGDQTRDVKLDALELHARDLGAVTFDAGTGLELRRSALHAEHLAADPTAGSIVGRLPLIWVQAEDVTIAGNRLVAPENPSSPLRRGTGGIRIAGGSRQVRIRRNQIIGGNGSGIVLGSVTSSADEETGSKLPPWAMGYGFFYYYWEDGCLKLGFIPWVSGSNDPDAVLVSDGVVERVYIVGNEIRDMGGDGIGVAWIFDDLDGDGQPDDVIYVDRLVIRRNTIESCCRGEFVEISDYVTGVASHGPITLADVRHLAVLGNTLVDCGAGKEAALAALSTWTVSGCRIEHNYARNNGSASATPRNDAVGGVILRTATPDYDDDGDWDGLGALFMNDNQIAAPQGCPLFVYGTGAMHVHDNVLASSLRTFGAFPYFGAGVTIINVGASSEGFGRAGGAGHTQLQNNQVLLREAGKGRERTMLWANAIVSADVLVQGNGVHADLGKSWALTNFMAAGETVQVQGNRFTETVSRAKGPQTRVEANAVFSAVAAGSVIGALVHNLGTHCFLEYDGGRISGGRVSGGHLNRSVVDRGSNKRTCRTLLEYLSKAYTRDEDTGQTKARATRLELDYARKKKHEPRPGSVAPKGSSGDFDDALADLRATRNETNLLVATVGAETSFRLEARAAMLERLAARKGDPTRAARHRGHAKASRRIASQLDDELLRTTARLRALPDDASKGASVYGRVVDAMEDPQPDTTVALLDAKGAPVAWAVTNRAGWYGFSAATVGEGMSLQASDAEGNVLSTMELAALVDGAEINEMLTLPVRAGGGAPPRGPEQRGTKG